uniref:Uncharacterized protein n=1 Tax=Aegilops tauschii subsp. strangulata TaxID=200361 RepID=A0A453DXX2_AEGTS
RPRRRSWATSSKTAALPTMPFTRPRRVTPGAAGGTGRPSRTATMMMTTMTARPPPEVHVRTLSPANESGTCPPIATPSIFILRTDRCCRVCEFDLKYIGTLRISPLASI